MKITIEFENLAEFQKYMGQTAPAPARDDKPDPNRVTGDAPAPAPAEAVQEPQEAPEAPAPKKNTKKAAPAEAEPVPEPADDAESAEVNEDFRITVRKQLAALNKKCGYNRAAELINEQTGKSKLTEVALADLPKLMKAAKEETDAD